MIKKVHMIALSFICATLAGCGNVKLSAEKEISPLTVVTATDLHYLSPELTDYGTGFMRMVLNGDGKLTQYAPELVDAFVADMERIHPEAVILSGDLSFNGERKSHEDLAKKLARLKEQGIPVLVLPGNHDIGYPFAASFEGESVTRAERVTAEEFRSIYSGLGYQEADAADGESLSFLYELSDRVWVLLLDANTKEEPGRLKASTLKWAEEQLKRAESVDASVITVTHQNVLSQNKLLSQGFLLENHQEVEQLLREYGVFVNLSGHVHIQHISECGGLSDIATGSLSVLQNQYGLLQIEEDGRLSYETRRLEVEKWDKKKAGIPGSFQSFAELSQAFFDACTRKKLGKELEVLSASAEEKRQMEELAVEMNRNYFMGRTKPEKELTDTEGWRLWKEKGEDIFFKKYMESMLEEAGGEGNKLVIDSVGVKRV